MISFKDKINFLFRNFFLQSCFNYERFQNIGFVFSILPFIKRIYSDNNLKLRIKEHFEIFNTQPYMSGFVCGNVVRMEEEKLPSENIKNIKQSLACAYASIGDRFFWSRLKVIMGEVSFLLFLIVYYCCSENVGYEAYIISVVAPNFLYAVYTIYIRLIGFSYGYECGGNKYCGLDKFNWNRIIKTLSRVGFFITVIIFIFSIFIYGFLYISDNNKKEMVVYIFVPVISFFIQRYFRKNKKSIIYPAFAIIIVSLILGVFI